MEIDTALRLGASLLAMLVLPFWLGTAGSSGMALAAFCLLAGLALTIVVDWPEVTSDRMSAAALLDDVALYTLSIVVPAGLSFAAARQFA